MGAAATASITLLSGKDLWAFPDNKRMKLNLYENQLDFRFLTNIASLLIYYISNFIGIYISSILICLFSFSSFLLLQKK